jgi:recombination protein RecT
MAAEKNLATALNKSPATVGNMTSAKDLVTSMTGAIAQALPKHLTADRMARLLLTEFYKNPKLMQCTRASIVGGVLQSSQLGLEIGSGLGHAYLIPFNANKKIGNEWVTTVEAQLVIGYQGMLDLARRSGELISIHAAAVRKGDHFVYKRSLDGDVLEHEERYETDDFTHFYAMARFKNGGHSYIVWPIKKIREHALRHSKVRGKLVGPWESDFEAMCIKTMIRALFKFLPRSVEIVSAITADGAVVNHLDDGTLDIVPECDAPIETQYEDVTNDTAAPESPAA